MNTSEQINELAEALAKAQSEFPDISKGSTARIKTKTGPEYSYKYADLADILKAATPVLSANGLAVTQMVDCTDNGNMVLRTTLAHKSGQFMQGCMPIGFNGGDPKQLGSMLTYYRRYSFTALVGICADEDDDANAAGSHDSRPPQQERQQSRPPARQQPHAPEPTPFDDIPANAGMVDYVASNGRIIEMPQSDALGKLWSAYNSDGLSNDAFLALAMANEGWLRGLPDHARLADMSGRRRAA